MEFQSKTAPSSSASDQAEREISISELECEHGHPDVWLGMLTATGEARSTPSFPENSTVMFPGIFSGSGDSFNLERALGSPALLQFDHEKPLDVPNSG